MFFCLGCSIANEDVQGSPCLAKATTAASEAIKSIGHVGFSSGLQHAVSYSGKTCAESSCRSSCTRSKHRNWDSWRMPRVSLSKQRLSDNPSKNCSAIAASATQRIQWVFCKCMQPCWYEDIRFDCLMIPITANDSNLPRVGGSFDMVRATI